MGFTEHQDGYVISIYIFNLSFDSLDQTVAFGFVQLQLCRTKIRKRELKVVLCLNSTTEVKSSKYQFFRNEIVVK